MNSCPNFDVIFLSEITADNERLISRGRCKMWTCEYCAEKNRIQWRAWLLAGVNAFPEGTLWSWFTLTAHSQKRKAKRSLANIRIAWDTLLKRMKRKYGKFQYVRVFEKHIDGSYHVHCLANFHFDDLKIRKSKNGIRTSYSKWLSDNAAVLRLGYYTHADNVPGDKHAGYVVAYVTKYITKLSPEFDAELGRVRHIQTSLGWLNAEFEADMTWTFRTGIYIDDIISADLFDITLRDINTAHKLSQDDFIDTYIYPQEFDYRYKEKLDKP